MPARYHFAFVVIDVIAGTGVVVLSLFAVMLEFRLSCSVSLYVSC